uniref:Helicase ATP-binding domain-containing protein n=1 Tax=Globodera pallida TaxID=36090 RepID=A0A183CC05_GLOPA
MAESAKLAKSFGKRKLAVECSFESKDKLVIHSEKSVELCACCSKLVVNSLMMDETDALTDGVNESLVEDSHGELSLDPGKEGPSRDNSEGFLPVDDVPNEDNELPSAKICEDILHDSSPSQEEDDALNNRKQRPKEAPRGLNTADGEAENGVQLAAMDVGRPPSEVNGTNCREEEAKRQFGITSAIEIPVSLQNFNRIVQKIVGGQQKLRVSSSIDDLERQSRSGKRLLSQLHRKKMRKLADGQGEKCTDERNDENSANEQNETEESDESDKDQPQTSDHATKRGERKRKAGPKKSATDKKKVDGDEKMEQDDEWLSKDSANRRTSSDHIDSLPCDDKKSADKLSDDGNESDSSASDGIPPPKMTRAQHQKNLELKKLFRQANRAMIDDDDDDQPPDEQSDQNSDMSYTEKGPKSNSKQRNKSAAILCSSSSEIVIDSDDDDDESIKIGCSDDDDDDDFGCRRKRPNRRKSTSGGYDVLTLGDGPSTSKNKQTKTKKQKKPVKKLRPGRKNRHMASDDESEDKNGSEADNSSDLAEIVPSSDEEVPKTTSSKKVISKKDLTVETKEAERAEKERRKRLEERQREFNGIELVVDANTDNTILVYKGEGSRPVLKSIVLDPDRGNDSPDPVKVHPSLVRVLKRHQAEGLKFLYNCTIESLSRLNGQGGGAILGHCMGLGKTLQIIAFLHTILSHPQISEKIHKVWTYSDIDSQTENTDRLLAIKRWANCKGPSVLIIGYDMFRRLTESDEDKPMPKRGAKVRTQKAKHKTKKEMALDKMKPQFRKFLFEAPHMIVCDEGHKLKNCDSVISKTINRISAVRRICLTGTPLQNNLGEYYCMVNFVKPNLLGNIKEFKSRFEHIINRGRTVDATRQDVAHMKRRCHVLHDRLRDILDRRDYTVLKESLPPKQEYVLMIRLTQPQIELYQHFLEFAESQQTLNGKYLLPNHVILYRIWTHPYLIIEHEREEEKKQLMMDDGFVVPDDEDWEENDDDEQDGEDKDEEDDEVQEVHDSERPSSSSKPARRSRRQNGETVEERSETPIELKEWAKNHVTEKDRERFELSNKLILLMEILKKCEAIGDKLLVFSQFLNSIALIQRMLAYYAERDQWFVDGHDALMRQGEQWSWKMGLDYDVINGAVSSKDRDRIQHEFNNPVNLRKRLLVISTRAGSLGINLVGANRVVIFDCCWNPSHDTQSLFRVYRFGQVKPVYIYRFVAQGTMEERIYNRQVTKESTARRVTEAAQIQRHYKVEDLELMYRFEPEPLGDEANSQRPNLDPPKDRLLGDIILSGSKAITSYHTHDLLLTSIEEEQLTSEERDEAWKEYENETQPRQQIPLLPSTSVANGIALPGTQTFGTTDMTHFTNALQLRQLQLLQDMHRQQQQQTTPGAALTLANLVQQSTQVGELGYFTRVMGQLMSAYSNDPVYRLCFKVPGMQPKTAYKIFQIKQFLSYFVNLIPTEDLGEMNNSNAFSLYFNGILQKAIQEKEGQQIVEQKAMITLATTIEIAKPHPRCQAGIAFIMQTFPEVAQHLDTTQ